jgi:virginiamycin B lyase
VSGAKSILGGLLLVALAGCGGGTRSGPIEAIGETEAPPTSPPAASAHASPASDLGWELIEFPVPPGSHPHDVAPAADGGIWYTGQNVGTLGHLDTATGDVRQVDLGPGSAPHGVIVGPDGAPWITDGGLNAIVRVDPATKQVDAFELPDSHPDANLNTAAFDGDGTLWFTGQAGIYGRLDPEEGVVEAFDAPRGRGPYGITATPYGDIWYASLAASHIARIDPATGAASVVEPPTLGQGARRIWSDSSGRLWVAEWNAGQVAVHDPADDSWREWPLPEPGAQTYAVYVDDQDGVWLTDFTANAIVRFDPPSETFETFALPDADAAVRQLLGRAGEVWGAESGLDRLVVIRER